MGREYRSYVVNARVESDVLGTSKSKCSVFMGCSAFIGRGGASDEVSAIVSENMFRLHISDV